MADTATKPRLKARYQDEIKSSLMDQFAFANVMQVPGVVKVVVNMGVGDAARDSKLIDGVAVNGSAALVGLVASLARKLQSGYLYHYAFAMILGLVALLALARYYWL